MTLNLETRDRNGRFVKGHKVPNEWKEKYKEISKGKHYSPRTEFKKGIVPWNTGKPMPDSLKKKLSLIQKHNPRLLNNTNIKRSQFKKGSIPWNKNKRNVYSKETIEKIQKGWFKKGHRISQKTEFKKGRVPWNKGKEHPFVKGNKNPMKRPEVRKKVSETNKIVIKNLYKEHPEIIQKIKENTKRAMQRPEVKQKMRKTWYKKGNIPWTKGRPRRIKTIRKIRNTLKEFYKNNPEHLKKILTFRRPNKSEKKLDSWIQSSFPNEFKFVGNGSFIIEGLNPDWINCNGKKQIIELFGERWHEPEEEQLRKDIFAKYGYRTVVIWYEELKNKELVLNKIQRFFLKGHLAVGKSNKS